MPTNLFPPQAYTKETLHTAYQWLQNQPAEIKKLATTPDLLVSLYFKSQLAEGRDPLERPSFKTFKSDLKSLAGMMGELDNAPLESAPAPTVAIAKATPHPKPIVPQTFEPAEEPAKPQAQVAYQIPPQQHIVSPPKFELKPLLDGNSLKLVQEIRSLFNLSSDEEALRMTLSVGHHKLQSFMNK